MIADTHQAVLSPAGAVWRYIRAHHPSIELYDADGSHPSQAGSYAVACAFYVSLFKKDPTVVKYDYTLSSTVAADIRQAAKKVVYDSMGYWHIGQYRTEAYFSYTQTANLVSFSNRSWNATSYLWVFGDGQSATAISPTHSYGKAGTYRFMLIARVSDGCSDTTFGSVSIAATGMEHLPGHRPACIISPNPCRGKFTIDLPDQPAEVMVLNSLGQLVLHKRAADMLVVDLQDLPAGLYLVRVINTGGEWTGSVAVH